MARNQTPTSGWGKVTSWIVGLTGVLVVIPSLINAGIDIYKALRNIPRTKTEKANVELFQKYFGKKPLATWPPLPVKQGAAVYEVKFSVWEEGDVFVEYGGMTQWFPFPRPSTAKLTLVSDAYAQDYSQLYGEYQQSDAIQGSFLIRNRQYANGADEQQVIDMRTGQIIKHTVSPQTNSSLQKSSQQNAPFAGKHIAPFAGIDLDAPKVVDQGAAPIATRCITPLGECVMVQPIPLGAQCYCQTPNGPIIGTSN